MLFRSPSRWVARMTQLFMGPASGMDQASCRFGAPASTRSDTSSTQTTGRILADDEVLDGSTTSYPVPVIVRRTFLEVEQAALRPPSLERFIQERRSSSCPTRRSPQADDHGPTDGILASPRRGTYFPTPGPGKSPRNWRLDCDALDQPGVLSAASTVAPASNEGDCDIEVSTLPSILAAWASPIPTDSHMDTLVSTTPLLGSPELPTVGSANHHIRRCKPCAFLQKGCQSGVSCKFCHLCELGEKKRRKKEKVAMRRELNRHRNMRMATQRADTLAHR